MKKTASLLLLLVLLLAIAPSTIEATSTGVGLYPFTRRSNICPIFEEIVELRVLDNADKLPGNFGWLTWDGSTSAESLAESLTPPGDAPDKYYNPGTPENGFTPDYNDKVIAHGKWVHGAPGNISDEAVRAWLDWHIDNETEMVIPLYDAVARQDGQAYYRLVAFAAFELQAYELGSQEKSMTGKFVRWVDNGPWVNQCVD